MVSALDSTPIRRFLYLQHKNWHFYGACGCIVVILGFAVYHTYYGIDAQQQSSNGKSKGNRNSRYNDKSNDVNSIGSGDSSKKKEDMSKSSNRGLHTLRFIASLHMMICLIGNYSYDEHNSSCRDRIMSWDDERVSSKVPIQERIDTLRQYTQERLNRCDVLSQQMYFDTLSHYPNNDNNYAVFLGRYGFTWAPWFIMLSGFLLSLPSTIIRIDDISSNSNEEPVPIETVPWQLIVYSKLKRIYPLYITCYILICIWKWEQITPFSAFIDVFLLQAWLPWTEYSMIPHAWFLSCMIPLWSIHVKLLSFIKNQSSMTIIQLFGQYYLYIWLVFGAMWPLLELTYLDIFNDYVRHHYGTIDGLYDFIELLLKFNPISYLPTYAAGVALAVIMDRESALNVCSVRRNNNVEGTEEEGLLSDIREKMEANGTLKDKDRVVPIYIYEYGTSIGMIGLLLFFCTSHVLYNVGKLHFGGKSVYEILLFANNDPMFGFRLGMLLPFHCMLIIGLSYYSPLPTKDRLRQCMEVPTLTAFGLISYSLYMFQFVFLYWWDSEKVAPDVFLFCVAASIIVTYLIDLPTRRRQWFWCFIGMLIVCIVLGGFIYRDFDSISPFRIGPVGYEQRIGSLWSEDDINNKTRVTDAWIRPAIHKDSHGALWIVGQKYHSTMMFNSTNFTIPSPPWGGAAIIWNSDIGVGRLDAETFITLEPMKVLCENHPFKQFKACKITDYEWKVFEF